MTANEEIQDRTIRHMVYLERYKISEIRRLRKILDTEVIPEITAKIEARIAKIKERGTDLGKTTTARLKELEKELQHLSGLLADRMKSEISKDIGELATHEIDWQQNTIKQSVGFALETVLPNPRAVAALINKTSFAGLTLDQWFDTISRSTQKNIMIAVNRGIVEGETTDQIVRRIRGTKKLNFTDGVYSKTRHQVETVARSTINHATNQARLEFFKENDDIISGLKWISTLDSRTSTICASLDGKVFPIDKGPRPPAHPNCRSTMTAVLKDADQLGLDLTEGKRASIDGQVPASTTYGQWLKKQPVAVQDDVLGVTRARLFRKGGLSIEKFVGSDLQPLTLEQLRLTEKNAFIKAGIN